MIYKIVSGVPPKADQQPNPICQVGVVLEMDSDKPLPIFIKPTERRRN